MTPGWVSGDAPAMPTTAVIRTAVSENFHVLGWDSRDLNAAPGSGAYLNE